MHSPRQLDRYAKAFAIWEREYRKDPAKFCTVAELAAMKVAPLSKQRAIVFCAYLRAVK